MASLPIRALLAAALFLGPSDGDRSETAAALGSDAKRVAQLHDPALSESSGLAAARVLPDGFWTHNDSGDSARIFLIDPAGRTRRQVRLSKATAVDWEDLSRFDLDGRSYLAVGDLGDNGRTRLECAIHLFEEPSAEATAIEIEPKASLRFRYDGGALDCEALAVDAAGRTILLVEKRWQGAAGVYELPLQLDPPQEPLRARKIAEIPIGLATAADVSPDGVTLAIGTYGDAFLYARRAGETWAAALARPPRVLSLPWRRQGEALGFALDGQSLLLTSEGLRQPIWRLPLPPARLPATDRGSCSWPLPPWAARLWASTAGRGP